MLHRRLDQRFDHARDRPRPPFLERILEIGRGGIDQRQVIQLGPVLADQRNKAVHVVALDLGHAGRANADQRRLGAAVDGNDGLLDILEAAEHGRDLAHGGGLHRNGFAEMAHEQHEPEGGAALAAVQQRHAALDAHEGERGADGLAHLQRIDRARFFGDYDLCHGVLTRPDRVGR